MSFQRYVIYIYMQCLRKLFSLQMHIKAGSYRKYWRRQCAPEALRVVICQSVECDDNALCNSFSPWLCTLITRNTVYCIVSVLKNLQWGYQNLQKIVLCFVQIIWNENFHGAYEVKYRD